MIELGIQRAAVMSLVVLAMTGLSAQQTAHSQMGMEPMLTHVVIAATALLVFDLTLF